MTFTYDKPLIITMGPKRLSVLKVKHGVTEISLSDGRFVRISLHIEGVAERADQLDLNYQAIVEIMSSSPSVPVMDVHEVVQ